MSSSNLIHDIDQCRLIYPSLRHSIIDGKRTVFGYIDVKESESSILRFKVKLVVKPTYPYSFPTSYETGGKFHKRFEDNALHINPDGDLCLDIPANERLKTKYGLSLINFIDKILIPNLCWRYCVLNHIPFDKSEHPHGSRATLDFYKKELHISNENFLMRVLASFVGFHKLNRNYPCGCGRSKIKSYKHCHERKETILHRLGVDHVKNDFLQIRREFPTLRWLD
jgi:hypothetical protein